MRTARRKIEESRARRKNRLRRLQLRTGAALGVLAALALAAGVAFHKKDALSSAAGASGRRLMQATGNAGFRVRDILVVGRKDVPRAALQNAMAAQKNAPIFAVDLEALRAAVEALPAVKSAAVRRQLPDKIILRLEERTPAALWQYQKKISVIDREGFAVPTQNRAALAGLPLVVGAKAGAAAGDIVDLLTAEPQIAARFAAATRLGGRRWDLRLTNGITVKLPEKDAGLALRRLAAAAEKEKIFDRAIKTIDLRRPENIVVTPDTAS